jgi:cytochrome c553
MWRSLLAALAGRLKWQANQNSTGNSMNWTTRLVAVKRCALTLLVFHCAMAFAADEGKAKKPDVAKGSAIANGVCATCHLADGNSNAPANPKLSGQHPEYLAKQLGNFKVQPGDTVATRANPVMAAFAAALTDDDMRNVAAYFSKQALKPSSAKGTKDSIALGQKIYRGGIAEKGLPACAGCHGPTGAGIPSQYPRLGGQWADYTATQLTNFREGVRKNNLQMSQVAAKMTDAEIKAVSDYIAGLR